MKYNILFVLISLILMVSFSFVQADHHTKTFTDFSLKDYNGKEYSLSDFADNKAIVILFIATQCPISNDYNERMAKIFEDYKDKGVAFLGINSNKQEDIEEIKEHAAENSLDFIILKDWENKIADVFEASFTPEIYVLSPKFELLYHGRIDDSRKESKVEKQDLRAALDEILTGKEVTIKETKAFGCTIKRVK